MEPNLDPTMKPETAAALRELLCDLKAKVFDARRIEERLRSGPVDDSERASRKAAVLIEAVEAAELLLETCEIE